MRIPARSAVTALTVLALVLAVSPASLASSPGARLEGLVVGVDGRPVAGYDVHLIDGDGQELSSARTDEDGLYSFQDLAEGEYSLGIGNGEGQRAPVLAPPVKLGKSELARRDLKLLTGKGATEKAVAGNYSLGTWWASLTPAAKAWTIVAIVVVVGVTVALVTDDKEESASPFDPPAP